MDEERWSGREEKNDKTVSELVDGLDAMMARNKPQADEEEEKPIRPKYVIIDPSATALRTELRRRGYRVKSANNDVLDGIQCVITALVEKLIAFSSRCKETIKEFGVYSWDDKAADRGEDAPIKANDHSMDAVRYFVRTMNIVKKQREATDDDSYIFM